MLASRPVPSFKLAGTAIATASLLGIVPATAQTPAFADKPLDPSVPVVVIVKVPKPWYAPKAVVTSKMRDTIPEYARLNGLAFKAFSYEKQSGDFGGVYYWRDAASAQSWFNPAWFERVKKERGENAQVRYLEAPVSIDNAPGGTALNTDSTAVVTVVDITSPAGVTRERLNYEFASAVPTYQKIPGLLRKHFTVTSNTFGGVYLWKDEASAHAWFNTAWQERVRKTYGQDAKIEWFDAPILLPTQSAANTVRTGAMVATP
jgi:heme-degrading monooxygenase HmoA